jgi:hypothetical protein
VGDSSLGSAVQPDMEAMDWVSHAVMHSTPRSALHATSCIDVSPIPLPSRCWWGLNATAQAVAMQLQRLMIVHRCKSYASPGRTHHGHGSDLTGRLQLDGLACLRIQWWVWSAAQTNSTPGSACGHPAGTAHALPLHTARTCGVRYLAHWLLLHVFTSSTSGSTHP